jgi:hypothetical protein
MGFSQVRVGVVLLDPMYSAGRSGQPPSLGGRSAESRGGAAARFFGIGHCIPRRADQWSTDATQAVWLK